MSPPAQRAQVGEFCLPSFVSLFASARRLGLMMRGLSGSLRAAPLACVCCLSLSLCLIDDARMMMMPSTHTAASKGSLLAPRPAARGLSAPA